MLPYLELFAYPLCYPRSHAFVNRQEARNAARVLVVVLKPARSFAVQLCFGNSKLRGVLGNILCNYPKNVFGIRFASLGVLYRSHQQGMVLGFVVLVYIRRFKERCSADAAVAWRRESVSPVPFLRANAAFHAAHVFQVFPFCAMSGQVSIKCAHSARLQVTPPWRQDPGCHVGKPIRKQ